MANRRELLKRRKSSGNIRKITRTMQLIATAKFQAAFQRATATRPYTEKLAELAAQISKATGTVEHPLMRTPEETDRSALLVITSNRGLCGGYNANVIRSATEHIERSIAVGGQPSIHMVGRKGVNFARFRGFALDGETTDLGDSPSFESVQPLADAMMDRFIRGEIASAHLAFMQFVSAGKQVPVVTRILPLSTEEIDTDEKRGGANLEFEFTPSPEELLDELLPATVRARVFQAFMDAAVSEQTARMVAMKAATDAAEDMIKSLTRQYNRARQTQITMELLDIIGGANALA